MPAWLSNCFLTSCPVWRLWRFLFDFKQLMLTMVILLRFLDIRWGSWWHIPLVITYQDFFWPLTGCLFLNCLRGLVCLRTQSASYFGSWVYGRNSDVKPGIISTRGLFIMKLELPNSHDVTIFSLFFLQINGSDLGASNINELILLLILQNYFL